MGCGGSSFTGVVDKALTYTNSKPDLKSNSKVRFDAREANNDLNTRFDPRCPLTARQKMNITKSWKSIARNIESTGIQMFLRLFETNEEVRTMFTKIVHNGQYDIAQLKANKELDNHVRQVMYTLDEVIVSLEDVEVVVNVLNAVARSHRRLKSAGFNPEIFWKIEEPFLVAVQYTLGDRYTANTEHIYRKTIRFIIETLIEGFNQD